MRQNEKYRKGMKEEKKKNEKGEKTTAINKMPSIIKFF